MTPAPITIALASGRPTYRGKAAPSGGGGGGGAPAWLTTQAIGTALAIPGNTLASINPELSLSTNPNYPSTAPYHGISGHPGIINAWGSAAWAEERKEFIMALQGGHGDWAGNENYAQAVGQDAANWAMRGAPTILANSAAYGVITNTEFYNGTTGLRAVHPYNNNIYIPGVGTVITRFAGTYPGGEGDVNKSYLVDTAGTVTLFSNWGLTNTGTPYGGAGFDASRNKIWTTGVGNTPLIGIDTVTKAASVLVSSNNFIDGYAKLVPIPSLDLMAFFHGGGAGYPAKFYLREMGAPATMYQPSITGTLSAGLTFNGQVGADWDAVAGCFYLWNNASNTNQITKLTPGANPRTDAWTASVLTFTGATVPTANPNGTYGRFAFSPSLGTILIGPTATDKPTYSLKVR